ncbi:hypothetical protein BRC85_08975 [Halobacteriales archaeon QS_1_69_70]|nr:MAG: hypothetical protein BRC85_08975 [Halobacteriales archaeon QS_1_69_70]
MGVGVSVGRDLDAVALPDMVEGVGSEPDQPGGRAEVRRVQGLEDSTRPVVAETSRTPGLFIRP